MRYLEEEEEEGNNPVFHSPDGGVSRTQVVFILHINTQSIPSQGAYIECKKKNSCSGMQTRIFIVHTWLEIIQKTVSTKK